MVCILHYASQECEDCRGSEISLGLAVVANPYVCSDNTCGLQLSSRSCVLYRVNDSKFGLQAGVFTHDMDKAFYAFEHMEVSLPMSQLPAFSLSPYCLKASMHVQRLAADRVQVCSSLRS